LLQRSQTREKIWVTTAGLTGLARQSNITRAGLTKLAETATHTGKQIELARLPRLAQTAAWIDGQIRLAGLTGLATRSIKKVVSVMLLTRKSGLWRIQPTRKAGLQKIRLIRKAGLHKIWITRKTRLYRTWGQETERRKRCCSKQKASSTVVPKGYYQDTKMQIAKDASKRVGREKKEEEWDYWFNHL
jgi:hypothetical protein